MDSDSENSDRELSHFSMNSMQSNGSNNHSRPEHSNNNLDNTADESMIVVTKKKNRFMRVLDSDSEESDSNNKANDSDGDENSANERVVSEEDDESEDEVEAQKNNHSTDEDEHSANERFESEEEEEEEEEEGEKSRKTDHSTDDEREDEISKISSANLSFMNQNSSKNGSLSAEKSNGNTSDVNQTNYRMDDSDDSLSFEERSDAPDSSEIIPATDDDEDYEEDRNEMSMIHAFSPRTRRSITGRRSMKLQIEDSDDDDEILSNGHDSNENVKITESTRSSEYQSAEVSNELDISDEFVGAQAFKRNRSVAPDDSAILKTPNPKRFSQNLTSSTPSRSTPDIEFSDKSNESQTSELAIQSIESSHSVYMKSISKDDDDDSIVLLNSSEEENQDPSVDFKNVAGSSTPGNGKFVQPKLQFHQPMKLKQNLVSREFYNGKADELAQLKHELKDNEDLYLKLGITLPDKGANLKRRIADLKRQVDKKENQLRAYAIEEDHLNDIEIIEPEPEPDTGSKFDSRNVNWRADLDTIQPIHTGKQGLATFNTQKTLTLNRIEKLHKALEKCPTETDFARQPDHLNIQLMPHQLHAIKWMRWRENQRPKGGLLADDMGLGKTLTVIGLVLSAKYGKDQTIDEEDQNIDTESEEDDDDDIERGAKKSFKNQGGTLIVCPASLINQWESEVNNRVKRRQLTVLMHHGNKRTESTHALCKYDLVITTYGIISSDHKNNGVLFRVRWDRLVLDEAHQIRNHSTAVSKGCCDLRSTTRWGLTGTPIQNKHMDVYSMLKFLRVTPFDDLPTFKKWINPNSEAGMSRLHSILKPLLLRRTKAELQTKGELEELPTKTMIIEDVELTPEEASVYTKILAYSQTLFAQYMEQHQQRNGGGKFILGPDVTKRLEQVKRFGRGQEVKSSQILILLLRLRQICDHPGLIHQMLQDECEMEDVEDEDVDSMDMNIVKQMIGLKINEGDNARGGTSSDNDDERCSNNVLSSTNKIYDFKNPSSKCKRTIEIVKRILRESDDKIVVVSQWTTFLSIVADFLNREKVHYVELTGKTPIKDRNNIVVSFNNPDSPERVLMLSLVAGGVGLNLTGANHLILLDPHWNPQLESQAFDRVYRVGQRKDVNIYKLLCEKTVEKKIQTIQQNKLQLSDTVLTGSKQNSGSKLSIQDMRKLFDM